MKHMLQDEQSRHNRMDALGFQPQNQVARLFLAAAEKFAKTVQLLGSYAAAVSDMS